jgi:hypothetical protein
MKKQLIFGSLLALSGIANSQTWGGSGTQAGNAYRTGNVGIGTTSPSQPLEVIASAGGGLGIKITQSSISGSAQGAILHLDNSGNTNGKRWALMSTGPGDAVGAGNFSIYDWWGPTGAFGVDRFFIKGSTGDVGIGTTNPNGKLGVVNNFATPSGSGGPFGSNCAAIFEASPIGVATGGWFNGATGISSSPNHNHNGVYGYAASPNQSWPAWNIGVQGYATEGWRNVGGYFSIGSNAANGSANYGVWAIAGTSGAGNTNYGIYANSGGGTTANDWAGYFMGNVYRSGTDNFTSDRKLKNDIKPLTNTLEKIKLLKPSSYTFKTDEEFKKMILPQGKQMGLIAQDLEEVFPELVTDMPEMKGKNEKDEIITIAPAFKSVQYISLIPVLISGIQEQQQLIEEQSKTNADLQKQINEQKEQINQLLKAGNATGINQAGNAVNGFALDQNIPNPFSNETVISYNLPQQVNSASLVVYDLSGKQITSFPITEKGTSSITISSEKLAAGIYIYSVMADGKILDSKRMVVAQKQ